MKTELIVVLDMNDADDAVATADRCSGCEWFKVGFQLFTRNGPSVVRALQDLGRSVMLDLKFHDIPNTVGEGARAAADLGVGMFTLHASGGRAMIEAARASVESTDTRVLAVTILTSLNESMLRNEVGLPETPEAAVRRFARQSVEAGAHGIVCSPKEIEAVREVTPPGTLIVTPGIRPAWAAQDDQQRVTTPQDAAAAGATHIVVGRPILKHVDPANAIELIKKELASV